MEDFVGFWFWGDGWYRGVVCFIVLIIVYRSVFIRLVIVSDGVVYWNVRGIILCYILIFNCKIDSERGVVISC